MLTLMHAPNNMGSGVTRQGGLGSGGGTAASRHRALSSTRRRQVKADLTCAGCGQPLVAIPFSEAYCTSQCATQSAAVFVPGHYYG